MRLKVPLRELSDLEVRFVSLVDRGANRIPFRIVKSEQENEMLNLSKIGQLVKKSAPAATPAEVTKPQATVEAVILSKSDDAVLGKIVEALKAEGFAFTHTKKFDDGTVALSKSEDYTTGTQIVSVGDTMAVVVKGFEAYASDLTFTEMAKARGFYDNTRTAMSALSDVISTQLYKSASQAEAKTAINNSLKEFNAYVSGLVDALPVSVFKAERAVDAIIAEFKVPEAVADAVAAEVVIEKSADGDADDKKPKLDKDGNPIKTSEAEGMDGKKPTKKEEVVAPAAEAAVDAPKADSESVLLLKTLAESMKTIQEQVSGLATTVQEIGTAQKSTEEKVAEALQKADTATRVVKSSVVVSSDTGGDPQAAVVKKADSDPRTGVFDSAFLGRSR